MASWVKFILVSIIICGLLGCSKYLCDDVACPTNGYCDRGSCNCEVGFMGRTCDSSWLIIYSGTYYGITTRADGTQIPDTVDVTVVKMPYEGKIIYRAEKDTFRTAVHAPLTWSTLPNSQGGDTVFASMTTTYQYPTMKLGVNGSCIRTVNQHIVGSWYFIGYRL